MAPHCSRRRIPSDPATHPRKVRSGTAGRAAPWRGADRADAHQHLLAGVTEIVVLDALRLDVFLPCLELVVFPPGVIKVLVEQDYRSGLQAVVKAAKDVNRGRI